MNITLKQLRVFCAIYELRSFTAAAQATFITQSAVSKLCTELEAEVGQPLFERTTRRVTPCEGAADFYAYAQEILGLVRAAKRGMDGLHRLERGTVGIATSPLMMTGLLGDVIGDFNRRHPSVKLDLFELSTDDTIDYVRRGRADFGIISQEASADGLTSRLIYRDTLYAVCTADHPLAQRSPLSWTDVASHEHIMLRNVYSVRRNLDLVAHELKLTFRYHIEAGMLASVLNFVRQGLGITVVPGYARSLALQLGLEVLPIRDARRHGHALRLIQRRNVRLPLAAQVFLEQAQGRLHAREAQDA